MLSYGRMKTAKIDQHERASQVIPYDSCSSLKLLLT